MNRPSCYGTTAKRSPHYRDHQCMNCLYILDCITKEKMLEPTKANPSCFGTLPAPVSQLYDTRQCHACPVSSECARETLGAINNGEITVTPSTLGTKLDSDKLRWSLLPSGTIAQVIAVLEYGAKKYAVRNWIDVPDAKTRYYDAAMRHLDAWRGGELNDSESGLPHLAHAACCLLFLLWFDGKSVS